jgi:chromosome partitioning protein
LDIICSNERVFPAELALGRMNNRELVLKGKLEGITGYDFVIIDCAPSINLINQNALLYSNEVVLPVSMEYMSLVGIRQLLNNIKLIHKIFDHEISRIRVVPTFYEVKKKKSAEILTSLNRVFPNQLLSPIRSSAALSEAPGFSQTAFEYAPKSTGAVDYTKLVNEVLANG